MQDEFEKKMSGQLDAFRFQPSPQVWSDVQTALKQKKRRRFVIWWWLLPLLLVGGGAMYTTARKNNMPAPITIVHAKEKTAKENSSVTTKPATPDKEAINRKEKESEAALITKKPPLKILYHNSVKPADKTDMASRGNVSQNEIALNKSMTQKNIDQPFNKSPKEIALDTKAIAKNDTANSAISITSNPVQKVSLKPVDSAAILIVAGDTTVTKVITNRKTKNAEKGRWYIVFGGGTLRTTDHQPFQSSASVFSDSRYVSNLGSYTYNPGTIDSTYKILKPVSGFHFTVGAAYKYALSKRLSVNAGLQYMYLSNRQPAGSKIVDSAQSNNARSYYQAGYLYNIRNTAHWLKAPVNIAFTINPRAATTVQFTGGLSYSRMLASRWLIADTATNRLFYSKELLQKNIWNWQAGAGIALHSGWLFGLQYQHSISVVAGATVSPRLYWQNINLSASIPLSKRSRLPSKK